MTQGPAVPNFPLKVGFRPGKRPLSLSYGLRVKSRHRERSFKKLGFYSTFIGWIMECVKMPTFSNMFKPPKSFKSSRGRDFGRVTHFPLYFMFLVWMYSQDICWNWLIEIQSEVLK